MKKNVAALLIAIFIAPLCLLANDYDDAWKALHANDRTRAKELLKKAMNDPKTAVDAYITWIYIQQFEGKEEGVTDFTDKLYNNVKNANPYLFSLWFNNAVVGDYGKKSAPQLALLEKMLKDPAINGSMKASAHYVKALGVRPYGRYRQLAVCWAIR
jgi:hypothetical protein